MRQAGFFGLSDHLERLSAYGDPLEELGRIIDFEAFRPTLVAALAYGDGAKGGRPPYDPVVMLKVLILAAQNNVSDARMRNRKASPKGRIGSSEAHTPPQNPEPPVAIAQITKLLEVPSLSCACHLRELRWDDKSISIGLFRSHTGCV